MSKDINDLPISNPQPPRNISLRTIQKELNKGVLEALTLMRQTMNNKDVPLKERTKIATDYAKMYLAVDSALDQKELRDGQKRLNILAIQKASEVLLPAGDTAYKSVNKLDLDIDEDEFE